MTKYATGCRGSPITLNKNMASTTTTTASDEKADNDNLIPSALAPSKTTATTTTKTTTSRRKPAHLEFSHLHAVRTCVRKSSRNTETYGLNAWYRVFMEFGRMPQQIDLAYHCSDTCTYYFLCCDLDPVREQCNAQTTKQLLQRLLIRYLEHRKKQSCDCPLTTYCGGVVHEPTPSHTHPPVKINTVGLQQFLLRPEGKCPTTPAESDESPKHTKSATGPGPTTPSETDAPPRYTKLPEGTHDTKAKSDREISFGNLIRRFFSEK